MRMALWIQFADGDNNQRPAPGDPWIYDQPPWLSPDLKPLMGQNEVMRIWPGQRYGIRARVHNNSVNPVANVSVQVWACRYGATPILPPLGTFTLKGSVPGKTAAGDG